jgi:hypothetical protein
MPYSWPPERPRRPYRALDYPAAHIPTALTASFTRWNRSAVKVPQGSMRRTAEA